MSIDRLRYFAAVVETRNLRKASELMGISPPSMSKAISVLEDELACKLIHPDGRGIGITSRGMEVYGLLTPLIEEYKNFNSRLREGSKSLYKLRIATFEVFSSYFMSTFLSKENELGCFLLEMPPGKIEQSIINGIVDMGITYIPSPDPRLEYLEIGSFEMGIFGSKDWLSRPFNEWPFAVPTTELRIHSSDVESLDLWPKSGPRRNIKYEFELLETALQTSRQGLSVLHCPQFITKLHNAALKPQYQLIELAPPSGYKAPKPTKIYVTWRKDSAIALKKIDRKLATVLRSLN